MSLKELESGNERFVRGEARHPDQEEWHRQQLTASQSPSVVVVGCSDSRVPPSVIFDQGLGFIFEIRTAGHVMGDVELGSIEYAVEQLGTRLLMVLGHSDCGAVTLAMADGEMLGHLGTVAEAVREVASLPGDPPVGSLDEAIEANVRGAIAHLMEAMPELPVLVESNQVMVVGAVYDIASGEVTVLD
jgi:carbonic anhydrase